MRSTHNRFSHPFSGFLMTSAAVVLTLSAFSDRVGAQTANSHSSAGEARVLEHSRSARECSGPETRHRPIQDFLKAQATTSRFYSDPHYPPVPDYAAGWTTAGFCTVQDPSPAAAPE